MPMPTQDPLANLRDIHTPPAIDFWPPALGWWLLAALIIVISVVCTYLIRRYRQKTAFKRDATYLINQLSDQCHDDLSYIQQLNGVLKQTALAVNPRHDIASLNGQAWLQFLDAHSQQKDQAFTQGAGQVLAHGPYQAIPPAINRNDINALASRWIKQQSIKRLQT